MVSSASDPPITIMVHSRSKIVDIWSVPYVQTITAVLVPVTIQGQSLILGEVDLYTIIIVNSNNIPTTGAMVITYPATLTLRDSGCSNDIIGGS
jgi:hypothetical protein